MSQEVSFYGSTVGKKIVVAATGFVGVVYVTLHMLGNLVAFQGPTKLNGYAAFLKSDAVLLWVVIRFIPLVAIILHIVTAYQLAWKCQKSRPTAYFRHRRIASTFAARTMRWSGPIIAIFIVYHLLHLTTGTLHPDFQPANVYRNVVIGFRVWPVSAFYVAAMLALGVHMYHGVWSMFQSVGANHPRYNDVIRRLATWVTVVVVIGFISIPVAVLLNVIS